MNSRLSDLKKLLTSRSIDAALISSVPDIIYLTGFSYFSPGEREAFLLITQTNNYIITDGRYSHAVKNQIKNFNLLEISGQTNFEKFLEQIIKKENIKTLGIDEHNLSVFEHKKIKKIITKHISLSSLRKIKFPDEIKKIQKACHLGDHAFTHILSQIKTGMTEKQIAFVLELFIRKQDAELSFAPIIAIEENAAIPHHKTGNRILQDNEFILLDFGVKYENYCSDMTRTIHFGKASSEKKKTYNIVLESQQKAIEQFNNLSETSSKVAGCNEVKAMTPSRWSSKVDQAARSYIISQGFPSIPHSLGHGIGLEVHESPSLSPKSQDILTNGMVFSIEPGIYLPAEALAKEGQFGIRIEDLFTIQNGKLLQLTNSPKNFIEL